MQVLKLLKMHWKFSSNKSSNKTMAIEQNENFQASIEYGIFNI